MKRSLAFFAFSFLFLTANISAQLVAESDAVIRRVADRLASVKLLGYKYEFEFNYPSQGRSIKDRADAFLDLRPSDRAARFRFQFSGTDRFSVYNGAERFTVDKKGKKIYVEKKPTFESFGDIYLMNAPLALKYALPKIAADKSISKNVTATSTTYLIEFGLPKKILTAEGNIVEIRPDHTNLYRLTVDKKTLLPVEVIQSNDKNDESIRTRYSDITEKPAAPDASSWFYSSYLKDYALQTKDRRTLIKAGSDAPTFELPLFDSSSRVSLERLNGRVVLLEFWIAHCGFCISAVPKLNSIASKFGQHGLQVVSINMYDPAATIDAFTKKNRPTYAIVTGGDSIAAAYGVEAYPAIVLIDADGKVVYSSSGLFEEELAIKVDAAINR